MNNYVVYHLHSDLSNATTVADSVTKYKDYIKKAAECGMTALGFSEHGNIFEHYHKSTEIKAAGMKYIHGIECYLTESLEEKIRDNMHCVIMAKDLEGFYEVNKLVSKSFNRNDGHFYYVPRVSLEELYNTSDHIIITSACIAGILGKGNESAQKTYLEFMAAHKDRCFLEVQHHNVDKQIEYNKKMYQLSKQYGIRLIAGTDTHALNFEHAKSREVLQKAKHITFNDDEGGWDLTFKTYDELVDAFKEQSSLPEKVYMEAIQNTNVLADMVKEYELDKSTKYPHIYDEPEKVFYEKIKEAEMSHPYVLKNHNKEDVDKRIDEEFEVYKKTKSIDFMLLQLHLREWEKENGIQCGYGRGSVSGSMIAYILDITKMDSMRFNLNFFRFLNPARVTNADIDTDYSGEDRDKVKEFLLKHHANLDNVRSAEIITFNTVALKGAIREVGRALEMPLDVVSAITKQCEDVVPDELRAQYPELFRFVDIINGVIVSIGTHPSGVLISDLPIEETVGLCTISTSDYPVSVINMKELDELMYVKLDILGLDNLGVINKTCKSIGIDRLTPDNTDLEDEAVWKSIRDDTTLIFQWESPSARKFLKKFMSDKTLKIAKVRNPDFSMIKWLSFGNGLIRPACASFRDSVANGGFYDNGLEELNNFLAMESGHIAMQETIMQFLVKFCGYSDAESDTVRRGIAKKKGTEKLIPEIESRFIEYTSEKYGVSKEKCSEVIKPFIQVIIDASDYAFSWNHSDAYSAVGYICGYLRYYYPLEFLTEALNVFCDDQEKTADIINYAQKIGIKVTMPRWGVSSDRYAYDKERNIISKDLSSIKFISNQLARELYKISNERKFRNFVELLRVLDEETSINSRQLDILIKLDFFAEFGNQLELQAIVKVYNDIFNKGEAKKIAKNKIIGTIYEPIIQKYSVGTTKSGTASKSYTMLDNESALVECERVIKGIQMPDVTDYEKISASVEAMGYMGYVSGKPEDKRKLYIMELYPLFRKLDHRQFGYSISTKSIGSGKESRMTVFNPVYNKKPFNKGDIIICKMFIRDGVYFRLTDYSVEAQ